MDGNGAGVGIAKRNTGDGPDSLIDTPERSRKRVATSRWQRDQIHLPN